MQVNEIGRITKITGAKVLIRVTVPAAINHIGVESFLTSYISVGSLVGTRLVDGRLLVMTVEEASMTQTGQSGETESVVSKDVIVVKEVSAHDRSRRR